LTSGTANRERLPGRVLVIEAWHRLTASWWRWLPVPIAVVYLILLLAQLGTILGQTYLDADSASAPVISQLFGSAGPHATTVLGTFGWYSTLLFNLATKWLPGHRQIWEGAPYVMALAAAGLTAWSVWQIAGRWAAAISAVLMVCAAPHTLHLLLSTTEHAPAWFCLALLGAYLVFLEGPERRGGPLVRLLVTLVVGVIIGVNARSDGLVLIAGLVPFGLAVLVCLAWQRNRETFRATAAGALLLAVVAISWLVTRSAMSAAHVIPQPGAKNTLLAAGDQISNNFKLWWQSIAVLGNGDFFGRQLSLTSGLAVLCAFLSIAAVALVPRIGWLEVHTARDAVVTRSARRLGFFVFWCSSAIFLTGAFLVSATPVDIESDRYLVGLIYAAAAVVPVAAAMRPVVQRVVVAGAAAFALAATISMANGTTTSNAGVSLSQADVNSVIGAAEQHHLTLGYAGYWEAAPITWASHVRVHVYPVLTCGKTLCPFYLHYISTWYQPHPGIARSFLLTDQALPFVPAPPPGLGRPSSVYHAGAITMYVYPYDIASRMG
jgi:hypothetical protein